MRRLFVLLVFVSIMVCGGLSARADNQDEANKIAQELGQKYPQYNIEVAYQDGKVRLRGDIVNDADGVEIKSYVSKMPQVHSVQESFTVTTKSLTRSSVLPQPGTIPTQSVQPSVIQPKTEQPAPSPFPSLASAPAAKKPVLATSPEAPAYNAQASAPISVAQNKVVAPGIPSVPAPQAAAPAPVSVPAPVSAAPVQAPVPTSVPTQVASPYANGGYQGEVINNAPVPYDEAYHQAPMHSQRPLGVRMDGDPRMAVQPGQMQGAPADYYNGPQGQYGAPQGQYYGNAPQGQYYNNGPQGQYYNNAPQGQEMVPGQNGQPNLPKYAWPTYADYPNYSQVAYPKQHGAKSFPYIGPYYPYPQVPLGWRKVTMEWHDGYWWLDFNSNTLSGPFSPLFRQPTKYR